MINAKGKMFFLEASAYSLRYFYVYVSSQYLFNCKSELKNIITAIVQGYGAI